MQGLQLSNIRLELTDPINSPEKNSASEPDKVVPDSFADWLAQPSQTITAGPEPEQGIFVGLMNECQVRIAEDPAIRPHRR
jgi:hypothetical protein